MPSHVTNASYIEPDFNTDFNGDPHSPVVVFGDHVNIEATAGSRSSGNSLPNVDKIVVASTNGWGGSGAIAPGTWVTISFGVSNDPQSASISFGTVGNPNSVRATDTFSGNGVRTYVVQMPATDLLITVSGVGMALPTGPGNFAYGIGIDTGNPNFPDLTISNFTADKTTVDAGNSFSVASVTASAKISKVVGVFSSTGYYLSKSPTSIAGAIFLGASSNPPVLYTGNSATDRRTLTVPVDTPAGDYYLLAVADYNGNVTEGNETNNISKALPITIVSAPVYSILAAHASTYEGDSDTTFFTFTVNRSGDTSGFQRVFWSAKGSGNSPADAADFGGELPSGTVEFVAGQTQATIRVPVHGDHLVELNDGFTVTLTSPAGAKLGQASANGLILNDDGLTDVDLNDNGQPAVAASNSFFAGFSWATPISADGRYVAFYHAAANFPGTAVGSNSEGLGLYVRDLKLGTTKFIGTDYGPVEMSDDGRYLAFTDFLSPVAGPNTTNVIVLDVVLGTTKVASTGPSGVGNGRSIDSLAMSPDGRYVAFVSDASNLVAGDTNDARDIFLRDTVAGTTVLIPTPAGANPLDISMSANARYIVYRAASIFLYDRTAGTTTQIVPSLTRVSGFEISSDGRFIVFTSDTNEITPQDFNNRNDVFLYDVANGTTTLVSTSPAGEQRAAGGAVISADGRYVAFESHIPDPISPYGLGSDFKILVKDMVTGQTALVAAGSSSGSDVSGISADGLYITFLSGFGIPSKNPTITRAENPIWRAPGIVGGTGNDTLVGTYHAETMLGGLGNDQLNAGLGNDSLDGGTGNDTLTGGEGNDSAAGGSGDDTYVFDDAGDVVTEAQDQGIDTEKSSIATTLAANVERLVLTGTGKIDGTGNALANAITGNGADNALDGGDDILADTLAGGLGNDIYVMRANDVAIEAVGAGSDTVQSYVGYTLGANLENLTLLGNAAINGTGNTLANVLVGNVAANVLDGGAGNDTVRGGPGADTLIGGIGVDVLDYSGSASAIDVTLNGKLAALAAGGDAQGDVATGFENITGSSWGDHLAGDAGANRLDGGAGADTMSGGLGNDTYVVEDAGDVVIEVAGQGADTVVASLTATLAANVERLTLAGAGNIDGTGNAIANVIAGNAGNNVIDGGAGNDTLTGGAGIDTLSYASATAGVRVNLAVTTAQVTGAGTDIVSGFENLTGSAFGDTLTGNSTANVVDGGVGNDMLTGGLGADTLTGGVGGDVFRFLRAAEGGDLIGDFNAAIEADKIGIVRSGFGIATTVAVGASFDAHYLVHGLTATEAHGQFLFDGASSALLWDADGTGATSRAVVIAVLPGVTSLNASDFKLL